MTNLQEQTTEDTKLTTTPLTGSWERRLVVGLEQYGLAKINTVERYTFGSNGTGEYSYDDDSMLRISFKGLFSYRVDGNKIMIIPEGSGKHPADLPFHVEKDRLILGREAKEESYQRI